MAPPPKVSHEGWWIEKNGTYVLGNVLVREFVIVEGYWQLLNLKLSPDPFRVSRMT